MVTKADVVVIILLSLLFIGMFILVDWRLRQVEAIRCKTWHWEICGEEECIEIVGEL